jgi:ABC-type nitrate/sulfonate/bicarbonate transport system substrate-binding protein
LKRDSPFILNLLAKGKNISSSRQKSKIFKGGEMKKIFLNSLLILAFLVFPSQRGHGAELQKVKLAIGTKILVPVIVNYWVGKYFGWFEEEGIDAEFLTSGGSSQVVQWLTTNQIEFGSSMPSPSLIPCRQRAGSRSDGGLQYNETHALLYCV